MRNELYALVALAAVLLIVVAGVVLLVWRIIKKPKNIVAAPNVQTMSTSAPMGQPTNVSENFGFYLFLWISGWVILMILSIVALATWSTDLYRGLIAFTGGPTFILLAGMYFAFSLKIVRASELAGAFFYGKALKRFASGLHFVPFGLMQLRKESRTVQQFQAPGEPETVFKDDDRKDLPKGMVRPIRIVTRAPDPGTEAKEILDTQMTIVVSFVFQYAVTDIFNYVANFGSVEMIHIQLRDIGESTVAEYATTKTTSEFIRGLTELNQRLRDEVQKRFLNSGVMIISARLISPDITRDVSGALADIPIARARAEQAKITADGEKTKRTKEGEGTAAAELALLNARAEGRKKIKDELEVTGDAVLASETVRELSDKTDVLIAGAEGGMKDVLGLVKGAQSALNKKGGQS